MLAVKTLALGRRGPPSFRRLALHLAQRTLHRLGLADAYALEARHPRATILMYHSVAPPEDERFIAPGNRVSVPAFERHCRYLARHRVVLALDELLDRMERGRALPVGTVLLTFDDGYRDTWQVAAPILRRYRLPATLYLATAYLDRGRNQWEDDLYTAYRHARRPPSGPVQAYAEDAARLLAVDMDARDRILAELRERLDPGRLAPRLTLSWGEARRLAREYPEITLGVHTDEHVDLTAMARERGVEHVRRSLTRFAAELGQTARHFSFPYCRVSDEVRRELPGLGLRSAMTTIGVVNTAQPGGVWDLRRLEAGDNLETIGYWTSGAHPDLSRQLFGRA